MNPASASASASCPKIGMPDSGLVAIGRAAIRRRARRPAARLPRRRRLRERAGQRETVGRNPDLLVVRAGDRRRCAAATDAMSSRTNSKLCAGMLSAQAPVFVAPDFDVDRRAAPPGSSRSVRRARIDPGRRLNRLLRTTRRRRCGRTLPRRYVGSWTRRSRLQPRRERFERRQNGLGRNRASAATASFSCRDWPPCVSSL